MSNSNSFFDWELTFRKHHHTRKKVEEQQDILNSIGIPISKCKEFLRKWREKNLD
ncbi:MAG: hypothetical protein ACFE96_15545 [Candidatus Hermodarchaeota archaeon]